MVYHGETNHLADMLRVDLTSSKFIKEKTSPRQRKENQTSIEELLSTNLDADRS